MKSNQLKIFVSSTFVDLEETRKSILKFLGVLNSDLISMEFFGSDESNSKDVCLNNVLQSNFFIGVYAERYGFIDVATGLSLTELEYHQAYEMLEDGRLKGLLLYLLDQDASWPIKFVDKTQESRDKMENFKKLISTRHTLSFFKDKNELPFDILKDTIRKLEVGNDKILSAKIRTPVNLVTKLYRPIGMEFFSQSLAEFFFGRNKEIDELKMQIFRENFSLLIGVSGMGKTSLLNAGIIPEMEKIGWLTCLTRPLDSPLENLKKSIWNQFMSGIAPTQFGLDDVIRAILDVNREKKVLIIIDQFDDILNYSKPGEIEGIVSALNLLFTLKELRLHILISYRGDVESEIGVIWQKISGAADGLPRYYLRPLDKSDAAVILQDTFVNLGVSLKPIALNQIILDDIEVESKKNGHLGIFPPFIQMVISTVFENIANGVFSLEKYQELSASQGIISGFLYNQLEYLGADKETGIRYLISLVNNYGAKIQKTLEEISFESEIQMSDIQSITNKLLDLRLIRVLDNSYEITHDLLAATILAGLMTDEEKDARRFKFLLESKAQAYMSTKSTLSFSEFMMVYKYREKIGCGDIELDLIIDSSAITGLPLSYWINSDNIHRLPSQFKAKLFRHHLATREHANPGSVVTNYDDDIYDGPVPNTQKKSLANLSLGIKESKVELFFTTALQELDGNSSQEYKLNSKTQYKKLLAAITIAKFGKAKDIGLLKNWILEPELTNKQRYIGMRCALYLAKKFNLTIPKKYIMDYAGHYWQSVLDDIGKNTLQLFNIDEIIVLIEEEQKSAGYLDYLVQLIRKLMTKHDAPKLLNFIQRRFFEKNNETHLDKYLLLALDLGTDYEFMLGLIKDSVNHIRINHRTLIHQRIADLCSTLNAAEVRSCVSRKQFFNTKYYEYSPEALSVKVIENSYIYTWIQGCAFFKIATRQDMGLLVALLCHNFYTIRHGAMIQISRIAEKEDLKYFINPTLEKYDDQREFLYAMFLLDVKANLKSDCIAILEEMDGKDFWLSYGIGRDLLPLAPGPAISPDDMSGLAIGTSAVLFGEDDELPF